MTGMEAEGLAFPWGVGESLGLKLPEGWGEVEVVEPDLSDPIGDYGEALRRALEEPKGSGRLEEGLGPGKRVALVVDDPSRWTPVAKALPVLIERIEAVGVRGEDISISVGVGRHLAVDEEAMARRVGPEIAERYRCYSPPVDDLSAYEDLGTTAAGIPARVFRPVAKADLRILVGSVLAHLQAGFGGGYKLIVPGCAHRSTLGAVHRSGLGQGADEAARLLGSDPMQNPMRGAIRSVTERLGPCFSVSHALGAPGQVFRVVAGDPDEVQRELSGEVARRFRAPDGPPADVVVAGNYPWPGDPMQSFKVLLNHRAAGRPGGLLVGLFWTDPEEIERSFGLGVLRGIAGTGLVGAIALRRGLSAADRVASGLGLSASFMIRWARELVVDREVYVYAPPLREKVGARLGPVRLFDSLPELWEQARRSLERRGVERPRVRLFPWGGLSYAPHPDSQVYQADRG